MFTQLQNLQSPWVIGCQSSLQFSSTPKSWDRTDLHKQKDLFEGMGKIKNIQVTLDIDPSIQPVTQRPYQLPHSMKTKVNNKLTEMRNQGIIEKV